MALNSKWYVEEVKSSELGVKTTLGARGTNETPVGGGCSSPTDMSEDVTLANKSGKAAGTRNSPFQIVSTQL